MFGDLPEPFINVLQGNLEGARDFLNSNDPGDWNVSQLVLFQHIFGRSLTPNQMRGLKVHTDFAKDFYLSTGAAFPAVRQAEDGTLSLHVVPVPAGPPPADAP